MMSEMAEPVTTADVVNVTNRYLLPGIAEMLQYSYFKMPDEARERYDRFREARDAALWNVGASYEVASAIGDAHWYGMYGYGDDG